MYGLTTMPQRGIATPMAEAQKKIGRPRGEQTENAARRRKQLIEAAIESLVTVGMSGTTLATVAKAAGLSPGVAVFYFKRKEALLLEALRYHCEEYNGVWARAVNQAGDDPIDRITALVLSDLDPEICTQRNLALWNSFWGETTARPQFAELCDAYDQERWQTLVALCQEAEALIENALWSPNAIAETLDALTDGMWARMHISPELMSPQDGALLLVRFLATVFPVRKDDIMRKVDISEFETTICFLSEQSLGQDSVVD